MAAFMDDSERVKIDDALRLSGLKFPVDKRVLGPKHIDLMMALGAFDAKRGRAGKQLDVVQRLVLIFKAVVFTQEDEDTLDIGSDEFYAAAMHGIAFVHPGMSKNLTPQTLRLVVDLYTQAFARSGWKVIKKPTKSLNGRDPADGAVKQTTEILEPIEPIFDRIQLEGLVKQWMRARGIARQGSTTNKKSVFHLFENINFPQQKPNETLDAYLSRLQHEFRNLQRGEEANAHVLSYVSDQRLERIGQLSGQNVEYARLLDQRRVRLDKKQDETEEYERLLHQRIERIDQQYEEINELKIKVNSMQQVIDQYGDNEDELIRQHNELDAKLAEATKMQIEIMKLELNAVDRQGDINHKLAEVVEGQTEIGDMQNELSQEVRRITWMQDAVADRQGEVICRQAQIMAKQVDVMDSVREILNKYKQD